ncbi:hypothetical protein [Mesorhizobium sanjuanii]|uniref:hypothetical protein n=1 Tax=Mesorhizobium sanjuanii TaxID=2037900 RepID=UPI001AD81E61|nr:hypothetical protein [Mesorhizobium sanjuanii]
MTFFGIDFPFRLDLPLEGCRHAPLTKRTKPCSQYGNKIDETQTGSRKSRSVSTSNAPSKSLPRAALATTAKRDSFHPREGSDGKRIVNA